MCSAVTDFISQMPRAERRRKLAVIRRALGGYSGEEIADPVKRAGKGLISGAWSTDQRAVMIKQRRDRVASMRKRGLTRAQMCDQLGIGHSLLDNDIAALKQQGLL